MRYLVRLYHTSKDKQNESTNDFKLALAWIGKSESDIYHKVNWLHFTDVFFRFLNDYIRVNNKL